MIKFESRISNLISMKKTLSIFFTLFVLICFSHPTDVNGQESGVPVMKLPDKLLATLKAGHPRLHLDAKGFADLKSKIASDSTLKTWYDGIVKKGEALLSDPVAIYVIPDGLRLLDVSRKVVGRISILGFLYQLTGDTKYAERGWKEMEAVSKFPDWNPKHFLDVGEMTNAFGLGYDWFYSYLNTDQRHIIKSAIIEKGLCRALLAYEKKSLQNEGWWPEVSHNWNQVCNGGIGIGALAIADEEPALSEYILRQVIRNLPIAMKEFGPDGAWNEGPGYWGYASQYNIGILSGLESSLGTDFGLSKIEGFSKTVLFPLYLTGPFNRSFNYADGGDGATGGSQLFWLANKFNQPVAAIYQKQTMRSAQPFDLIWYPVGLLKKQFEPIPLANYYRSAEVMTMRSAWNDPKAWFVGFKAGDNKANHSNLDLGSFVLDALGKRWIFDLGADNYNMPGYFSTGANGRRWEYYRMRAEGHNTIVLNPGLKADQNPLAAAKIVRFGTNGRTAFAVADLTPAYAENATNISRGIALVNGEYVIIQDNILAGKPASFFWFLHTRATLKLENGGRKAVFSIDNEQLVAEIISPSKAKFKIMNATPLPGTPQPATNNKNEGIRKLSISMKDVTKMNLIVSIKPLKKNLAGTGQFLKPLDKWE